MVLLYVKFVVVLVVNMGWVMAVILVVVTLVVVIWVAVVWVRFCVGEEEEEQNPLLAEEPLE